jgi:response regulator RpfG family c-di-GMP phosphodiesterase
MTPAPPAAQGAEPARPRVLCVDDEQALLDGLRRQLRGVFEFTGVTSGEDALGALRAEGPFAVIVSDMKMPGMDGVEVLSKAWQMAPDTTRLLLTGFATLESAVAAVNQGNVFRLLLKPCSRADLVSALEAANEQYRLKCAERDFFEKTPRGAVDASCETLFLANPQAFARATRARRLVVELMNFVEVPDPWCVEVAATLSQIGTVALPPPVVAKLHDGLSLNPDEQELVDDLPVIADAVLARIPRLDTVRQVIRLARANFGDGSGGPSGPGGWVPIGARLLRVALDLDTLEAGGLSRAAAIEVLSARQWDYDPRAVRALAHLSGADGNSGVAAVSSTDVRPGAVVARDLFDPAGRLLVGRGHTVTPTLLEHMSSWRRTTGIVEPVYVKAAPLDRAPRPGQGGQP